MLERKAERPLRRAGKQHFLRGAQSLVEAARAAEQQRLSSASTSVAVEQQEGQATEMVAMQMADHDASMLAGSMAACFSATRLDAPQSMRKRPCAPVTRKQVLNRPPLPKASPLPMKRSSMVDMVAPLIAARGEGKALMVYAPLTIFREIWSKLGAWILGASNSVPEPRIGLSAERTVSRPM